MDESGLITIDDLKEGLTSLDLYNDSAEDRKMFLALGMSLLEKTQGLEVRIKDICEILEGGAPDFEPINREGSAQTKK